jgi:hypothetical protein
MKVLLKCFAAYIDFHAAESFIKVFCSIYLIAMQQKGRIFPVLTRVKSPL